MAQGFVLAKNLLVGGRPNAFSGVVVLTDGSPSFVFETKQVVSTMEQEGIMRYMLPITDSVNNIALMEDFASEPAEANMVQFKTIDDLRGADFDPNIAKCIRTFCPRAANCYDMDPNYPILVQSKGWGTWKDSRGCRKGYQLVGGGCDTASGYSGCKNPSSRRDFMVSRSAPAPWNPQRWQCNGVWATSFCVPDFINVDPPTTNADCSSGECTALCKAGKVSGGGCRAPDGTVRGNHPKEDGTGWTCVGDSIAEAFAICIPENFNPRIATNKKSMNDFSSGYAKVSAKCTDDEQLVGGGCLSSDGSCVQQDHWWRDNEWHCQPTISSEGDFTAFAICGARAVGSD